MGFLGTGNDTPDRAGVIAPPPLIFTAALLLGLLMQWAAPVAMLAGSPLGVRTVPGVSLVGAAMVLALWAALAMRRAGTNIDPRRPTTALVVTGPFHFTRNPLYLSLTLLYLGITALANALGPLVLLPAVLILVQRGVIEREERYLERKFGEAYREYRATVRRWL